MDIIAHALWTAAVGATARKRVKHSIDHRWAVAWGIAPDVVVFLIPACVRIGRFLSGASQTLLPDGHGPHFDWVWGLYNCTHSAVVFAACFAATWAALRRPALEMSGWLLHIVIDIFTHRGIFAVRFLWPLSYAHFDGVPWERPSFLITNYVGLALIFSCLWLRKLKTTRELSFLSDQRPPRMKM